MDAVIFDCDGVLVDSETIAHQVELEAFTRLGFFIDVIAFKSRIQGLSVQGWGRVLNELHLAQLNRPLPEGVVDEVSREITRRILADVRPIPGAKDAVRSFRGRKAVASSSPKHELAGKITQLGLWGEFRGHVYSGEDVNHAKPAPDLFLLAADRLDVSTAKCVVIEDSVNGVIAGVSAGMTVWGFVGGPHCGPDHHLSLLEAGAVQVYFDMERVAQALRDLS